MIFSRSIIWFVLLTALAVRAQTNAFIYQGQLANNGGAATGNYDFRFRLFDGNTNLIAGPVTNAPVGVTNGLFTTGIDFGSTAFNGGARLLEIGVRNYGNTNAYTVLDPYQPVLSVPYAIQSLSAASLSAPLAATNITGMITDANLPTNVALLTSNVVFQGSVTAITFSGSGAGLTGVPDSALSTNIPRLNNASNTFSGNISAVQYTGSGYGLTNVPGAFFWLTVNGTNAQASSNLGFITTNNVSPVIITLPASPNAGDTFRVAGAGAAGWILVQNTNQSVLAGNLAGATGLAWTQQTNSGVHNWTGLAASANGTRLIAVSQGYIYVSTNSGVNWYQSSGSSSLYWSSVAASANGSNVLAAVGTAGNNGQTGDLYTSTDGGNTWAAHALATTWTACASSASGSTLAAVSYSGYIYTSTNSGSTWNEGLGGSYYWTGVACSQDGAKMVAVGSPSGGGYIYTSTNSGATWQVQTNAGLQAWSSVASSADGTHLVATVAGSGGEIYVSANSGVTWSVVNQNSVDWVAVTSSDDGSRLAAVYNTPTYTTPGYVYTSDDSGSTWQQRLGAPDAGWSAITSTADGSKLAAAVYNGYIYTSGQASTTTGTGGYLIGGYQSALELQYVGNGMFIPLSHEGTIRAY